MRFSRFGRSVSTVSGAVALVSLIGSSSAAIAATPTSTEIVLTPIRDIAYGDSTVTIHGTLETGPASGARPIAGEPVALRLQSSWSQTNLGTVTTDDDGSFSLTTTLPEPGSVVAEYAGDADYDRSSHAVRVTATHLPARVTL